MNTNNTFKISAEEAKLWAINNAKYLSSAYDEESEKLFQSVIDSQKKKPITKKILSIKK